MQTSRLFLALALTPSALAQTVVDGTIAGDDYGPALAVQAVQTGFGDNQSELDAAYGKFENGRLVLALTGNLAANFDKLEIFVDSVPGGQNVFAGIPGNDGTGVMVGTTFDPGFRADRHIIVRRGFFVTNRLDLDISILGTSLFSVHTNIFGGASQGSGTTGTGPANAFPIEIAYDGSNLAGVTGGTGAADQAAALAVQTGLELAIHLADLGDPMGDLKVCVFINDSNHDFASNQFLGPLAPPQGNLGGDGLGNFTGALQVDLGSFPGEQFFVVPSTPLGRTYCQATPSSTGASARISATGSTSLADDDLTLHASPVPAEPGLFFLGPAAIQVPFGNGFRCVGGQVVRLSPGAPVAGVRSEALSPLALGLVPGRVHFQYWFRDPSAGGALFDLSNGLELVLTP